MNHLNPEFLTKNGKKYVLLPYDEFLRVQELLEDLEDLQDLRAAKEEERNKPSISLEELKQMF
ncbi:MAG: type II toxin-antitoxin system Phd/YefM family antitoxin [Cyanobacteriota bacterium]|nr:type II toxin-antitoxin system Phd/YefM family antitoxin [Cyanobacteriota bacterium]